MNEMIIILLVVFFALCLLTWSVASLGMTNWQKYQHKFTEQTGKNLESMFVFIDAKKVLVGNVGLIILLPVVVYFLTKNLFATLVAFLAALAFPKLMMLILERQRKEKITLALPDALAQIAGSMQSGSTFTSAIETLVNESKGPISQEFGLLLKEQKMGISTQDALENLGERINSEDIDLVVTAAMIAREVGGNLAEILERLSVTLRRKIEMEGKIKALTSQGKLQGIVVSLLPFAIIGALSYVEPEGIEPIFSTWIGWGFLVVIIILELLGAIMIRKIVSIDV